MRIIRLYKTAALYSATCDFPVVTFVSGVSLTEHPQKTIYELIGGDATFRALVERHYAQIEADPVLKEMFPDDLEPGKEYQFLFLTQYFGGPTRYAEKRGHPRLRMRHMPFVIDERARDLWLEYMIVAMRDVGIEEPAFSMMKEYFERAASFMINSTSPPPQNSPSEE